MQTIQANGSVLRSILFNVAGVFVACILLLTFIGAGPPTADGVSENSNRDLKNLLDDAYQALHSDAAASQLTVEERRAWRDKLLAAVPSKPSSPLEGSILLEAGRASQEIGDIQKWRSVLLDVAKEPAAGYLNRMNAAQLIIGFRILLEDPQDTVRALDWYAEAAREREREPDQYRRQGYTMQRDTILLAASFYRGQAFLDAAMHHSMEDTNRRKLAARSIDEYASYLNSEFGGDANRDYPATRRYLLYRKGLAHAILADEQAVLKIAAEMSRTPQVNTKDLQETIGYFLYKACELVAQASHPAEALPIQTPTGREFLRRFEGLVAPEDPYYVGLQRQLARADEGEQKWMDCVARTEKILNSSHPQVRAYLEANPASWADTLYLQGDCLMKLGRRDDAQNAFRELLSRFPDDGNARAARVRLENNW